MVDQQYPLYHPELEHESCGVGAIVDLSGRATHRTVDQALTIVERLAHRAGSDALGTTGDGVGIMTRLPHEFFTAWAREEGISLGKPGDYGVGMFFLPEDEVGVQNICRIFDQLAISEGVKVLGWRDVPCHPAQLGAGARRTMPRIRQCFLKRPADTAPRADFDRKLYILEDLHIPQPTDARRAQASRCMNCGVPFCQSDFGCPLHNLIPEWNDLLYRGKEREALERLLQTAPFREFTGRVCPALCEKACNLESDALTNRDNELYLIETGFEKGWVKPRIPRQRTGKRIAVVGSGPSGLACANLLNRLGHEVTVIERADCAGGLLMYGIPNMKLPKAVVERRIRLMEAEGVRFQLNTEAKSDIVDEYDAVVLCGGAKKPRALNVEGVFAVDYLTAATRAVLSKNKPAIDAGGRHVVVVGGGDTGNDCVGTALRQGCASVIQLEMMPAPPVGRIASNPWPEWPRTLRTDYGQLEAIHRQGSDPRVYETTVKRLLPGQIETVKLKDFDPIPGTERIIPCDLLLIAAGFVGCETATAERFNVKLDPRGCMRPENGSHRLRDKLFSAGDMRTGQSLVVRALADGRAAAMEIHNWLGGKAL